MMPAAPRLSTVELDGSLLEDEEDGKGDGRKNGVGVVPPARAMRASIVALRAGRYIGTFLVPVPLLLLLVNPLVPLSSEGLDLCFHCPSGHPR